MDERASTMSKKYDKMNKRIIELELRMAKAVGEIIDNLAGLGCNPSISNTSATCAAKPMFCLMEQPCQLKQDKEDNMYPTATVEMKTYDNERRSLRNALYSLRAKKEDDLRKHYNIDCESPRDLSPKELVDKITSGKFKFKDDGDHSGSREWYCNPLDGICLCDPDKEPKYEEFHAAREKMTEDGIKIDLDISVLEPEAALKSYRKFEERTYH
jgi:hypothetical protein